jgi:Protein of unknown function (Hypoth_ymh)
MRLKTTMKPIEDAISDALPTVQHIIRQFDPRLLTDGFGQAALHGGMLESTRQTRRALAVLRDREDWKINLAPDSPSLPAEEFHPSIWSAAAPVWDTGEYKMAAQSACVSLSAHIKDKAGSPPLNELALVAQVFSMVGAQPGQCRLHFPGDHSDENSKSRQQGLHFLAQRAFAGIANIAAYENAAWTDTRPWSILPCSPSSHDGLTRLIWYRCDHNARAARIPQARGVAPRDSTSEAIAGRTGRARAHRTGPRDPGDIGGGPRAPSGGWVSNRV